MSGPGVAVGGGVAVGAGVAVGSDEHAASPAISNIPVMVAVKKIPNRLTIAAPFPNRLSAG